MKILQSIREKGIRWCLAIVLSRCVPSWLLRFRKFNVYEMDADSVSRAGLEPVEIQWADSETKTNSLEALFGPQRSVVDVGAEHMKVCYANCDGEIAGALWMAEKVFVEHDLGVHYELGDDKAWLFGASVSKSFRRRGIYSKILSFILPDLTGKGKRTLLLAVNPDNVASRVAHEKYAKRKIGTVIAGRFLSIAFCRVEKGMKTNRSFTWNHKAYPIVIRFESEST